MPPSKLVDESDDPMRSSDGEGVVVVGPVVRVGAVDAIEAAARAIPLRRSLARAPSARGSSTSTPRARRYNAENRMDSEAMSAILRRARDGDREALGELLLRAKPQLERAARAVLGDDLRARVRTSDLDFRGRTEEAFAHWVARILENNVRDAGKFHGAQRRAKKKESSSTGVDFLPARGTGSSPSATAALSDELVLIGRAMQRLPEDYRRVILLSMKPGANHTETAQTLQRSVGATRVLLARARATLILEMDRLRTGAHE
jgi:DNA-directed RNA polymerase specialized sigma24 family protein